MGTSESKLGFARSHLVLSLPRPDRAASPQDCTSTGLWGNSHLRVPHDPAGALSPACASVGMDLFPAGNSRFSREAGAPASLPAGLHKEGNSLGLLRKECALLSLTWPERGLHPSISEWVSNYNNYNLLELAIKGCLKFVVLYKILILFCWY